MTLGFWTACAAVVLCVGFLLGWFARDASADLELADAEYTIALAMQRHLPVKVPGSGEVWCMCMGPDGPLPGPAVFDGPVQHRRHVAHIAVQMLTAVAEDQPDATIIDFPERPGA